MNFDAIPGIVALLISAWLAYTEWRRGKSEDLQSKGHTRMENADAIKSIVDAAQTAIGLTRDTSTDRLSDKDSEIAVEKKLNVGLLETIANLNRQVSTFRLAGEEGSRTLMSALNAMDQLRQENFELLTDNTAKSKRIAQLESQLEAVLKENAELAKWKKGNGG